jgi:basic membrane protein A and related proteins
MKRFAAPGLVMLLIASLAGTAAVGRAATATHTHPRKSLSVLLYVSGALGDLGFFDSAHAGVESAAKDLGATVKVVQNADTTQWKTQVLALAGSHKYDLIIFDASTWDSDAAAVIKRYPHQRFINFDDNTFATSPNVSSIIYKQNEGSFLAGALAGMVADDSKLPYVSHKKVLGMVGGMNIQVINDFKVGYMQGAHTVDPRMVVPVTYIGGSGSNDTWNNKPAGVRLAASLYDQGAAAVYQVAGGSGLGVLDEAKIKNRYAIGVDSNQDNFAPGHVIGSVVKRVDNSLFDLLTLDMQGKLKGAHVYYYGLQNHGVALTRDAETRAIIPASMYDRLDALAAEVATGKIKVPSTF